MLSYKQWKMLNESIMPSFNLGLVNPSSLGIQPQSAFMMDIEEAKMAKKKAKKKMFGDDDETGDGEMVEPSSDKDDPDVDVNLGDDDKGSCGGDKCGAFSKKKSKKASKKKCGADSDMDMDDDHDDKHSDKEDDDAGGDENELMFSKKKAKKKMMKSKKKMWGDDDDAEGDEDDDDHHDDEEHGNDDDDSDNDDEDDFDGEDDGDGDDGEEDDQVAKKGKFNLGGKGGDVGGGMGDAGPMFSKKKSKKASKKKMTAEAAEVTEDEKWWNSVRNMTASNPDQKYGDGWTEYQTAENLFTPVDTENLTQAVRPGQDGQPGPGEVGFAPQGRIN